MTTTGTAGTRRPLMDLPAIAERLGVNHRHVRRLVHERRIPFIKWGHLLRFDPDEIDESLEQARRPPAETVAGQLDSARVQPGPQLARPPGRFPQSALQKCPGSQSRRRTAAVPTRARAPREAPTWHTPRTAGRPSSTDDESAPIATVRASAGVPATGTPTASSVLHASPKQDAERFLHERHRRRPPHGSYVDPNAVKVTSPTSPSAWLDASEPSAETAREATELRICGLRASRASGAASCAASSHR
ncbi:MAG: excisionase family DNA-binding protein [Acidimicrobiia bacterium]|nr:excisionase family DNA-binding protein [Acidimicrobiia bacterium]